MTRTAIKPAAVVPAPKQDFVEIFSCAQRSDEWRQMRCGIVTASVMSDVMAGSRDGGSDGATRKSLLYNLAGEILCGEPAENFTSKAMERGIEMEPLAREDYAFRRGADLEQVGFVRRTLANGIVIGCSPDSLVGEDGVLEIKTMKPDLLIRIAERGTFPTEHRAQVHGSLWVTGRKWCDLVIFYRGMPVTPTFRVERDDVYIRQLSDAVEVFDWELKKLVEKMRNMGRRR